MYTIRVKCFYKITLLIAFKTVILSYHFGLSMIQYVVRHVYRVNINVSVILC